MLSWALLAVTTASARAPATWSVVSENDSPWSLMWIAPPPGNRSLLSGKS